MTDKRFVTTRLVTTTKWLFLVSMCAIAACSDGSSVVGVAPGSGAGGVSGATGSTGATGSGISDASMGSGDVSTGGSTGRDSSVADQKADVPVPVYEQDDPNLIPPDSAYQRVKLPVSADGVISIDVTDDDEVFVLERAGKLSIWKPDGTIANAGQFAVFAGNEDGALSVSLDPNFATNHFIYVYYSSNTVTEYRLARFEIKDDTLHLSTEKTLIPNQHERGVMWHVAGVTDFDSKGNLYLGVGDNTNPVESDGYAPLDRQAGRSVYDSERTAGNSRDLRGKILRIKPKD